MPQTSISYSPPKGYEGMCASHSLQEIRSALQELTVAGTAIIYPGRACVMGANPGQINLPSATGGVFMGLAVLNDQWGQSEADLQAGLAPGYKPGQPIGLATFGDWFVYAEVAVNVNDPVYFRHTAAAAPNDAIGRYRNAATTGFDQVPKARFLDKSTGAGLVRINLGGLTLGF